MVSTIQFLEVKRNGYETCNGFDTLGGGYVESICDLESGSSLHFL